MRRIFALAFTALALLAVESFALDFSADTTFSVERVVDGDTILIDYHGESTRVRLIGVDTPETVHPRKPVECYGPQATTFTTNLLKSELVFLRFGDERRDRFDRLLAYVYRSPDGLFVNEELVRQGYARAYLKFKFEHAQRFRDLQTFAQMTGKGLWGTCETVHRGGFGEATMNVVPSNLEVSHVVQVCPHQTGLRAAVASHPPEQRSAEFLSKRQGRPRSWFPSHHHATGSVLDRAGCSCGVCAVDSYAVAL